MNNLTAGQNSGDIALMILCYTRLFFPHSFCYLPSKIYELAITSTLTYHTTIIAMAVISHRSSSHSRHKPPSTSTTDTQSQPPITIHLLQAFTTPNSSILTHFLTKRNKPPRSPNNKPRPHHHPFLLEPPSPHCSHVSQNSGSSVRDAAVSTQLGDFESRYLGRCL